MKGGKEKQEFRSKKQESRSKSNSNTQKSQENSCTQERELRMNESTPSTAPVFCLVKNEYNPIYVRGGVTHCYGEKSVIE
jgi:hypothetical protein